MKNPTTKEPSTLALPIRGMKCPARSALASSWWGSSLVALVFWSSACERTAEGIKQDTLAVTAAADQKADQAKNDLDSEVSAFKAKTNAKLEQLNQGLAELETKAGDGLDTSKQKLKLELEEARTKLSELKAESNADWERAKSDLDKRVSDLGKRMNTTLDEVGDKVEKTLD